MVLFLLMAIGCVLMRLEIFTKDVTYHLSKLLTMLVAPSLFISSFISRTFNLKSLIELGIIILFSFFIILTCILLVHLLLPKHRTTDKYATIFANVVFMGTPLAFAVEGQDAVFYISGFVVANQISQWTYGIYLISNDTSKSAILNPVAIATFIGLLLFILPIQIPYVLKDTVNTFAQLNTPLATLVLGS